MDEQKIVLIAFVAGLVLTLISAVLIFSGTYSIYVQIGVGIIGLILVGTSKSKLFG